MYLHAVEDLDQQAGQLLLFCWGQGVEQVSADPCDVGGCEAAVQAATVGCELRNNSTAVLAAGLALDQSGVFEAADAVSQPAGGEERLFGQVAHPEPAAVGFRKVGENVVVGERHPVPGLELTV